MKHWGTLRIKESNKSGIGCRVITIKDKPLTGYLSHEECEYIISAINAQRDSEEFAKGFEGWSPKDFAEMERDSEIASNNARQRENNAQHRRERL